MGATGTPFEEMFSPEWLMNRATRIKGGSMSMDEIPGRAKGPIQVIIDELKVQEKIAREEEAKKKALKEVLSRRFDTDTEEEKDASNK